MNPLVCPNPECGAVLSTVHRVEYRVYVEEQRMELLLQSRPTDLLRRLRPQWLSFRYWGLHREREAPADGSHRQAFRDRSLHLYEEFDPSLRQHRRLYYECPYCHQAFDPADQGWVDPLEIRERPSLETIRSTAEDENSPAWSEYTKYGALPSLIHHSTLVAEQL